MDTLAYNAKQCSRQHPSHHLQPIHPAPITPVPTPAPIEVAPQRSPWTSIPALPQTPMQIPQVCFQPNPGGISNSPIISWEAINSLTKCVWAKSSNIFMPKNLMPTSTPMCLNYVQVVMPMVHPITGKSISTYKRLMNDPTIAEMWQTAFGKDFGGMVQGNLKTGQTGTNSIFCHDSQ